MKETVLLIDNAIKKLGVKLKQLDVDSIDISAYNKNYLLRYINNYSFYMNLYKQLLLKAISKLSQPVANVVFVDYGGGCGILSFLAKEIGFKKVVYNDLYITSVNDVKIIAQKINIYIDDYIAGDVEKLVTEINTKNIRPDLICSFDVLEHIYNLHAWMKTIAAINNPFNLLFITSANSKNPFIKHRLKKIHLQAEYKGFETKPGWKTSDTGNSFLEERKKIIKAKYTDISDEEINNLAAKSRGLIKDEIYLLVEAYLHTGVVTYAPHHPTNTCDPHTGNWAENLIDLTELKNIAGTNNFSVNITNTYYGYSKNKLLNIPKQLINTVIKFAGKKNLFFSPMYVLEISKK
ncbi:MAG: methyltransferase domain-containing protein [Parafilimonas sp.]